MRVLSSRILITGSDFARSRRFYEETIGLDLYREYGVGGVVTGVVYFLGGGFLELTASGPSPTGVRIWIQVADVAAEESRLAAAGVTVRQPATRMPWGLIECWIEDPDGVELRLIEVPPDHPIRRRVD
ncbi:MAG: VOC family protein [Acidimicrobiia bacterium]|nr:VOC family protein [Acidimicrobiia bacterium]